MQPRPGKRFKSGFRVIQRRHGRGTAASTHHQLHSAAVEDLRVDLRQKRRAEDEIMRTRQNIRACRGLRISSQFSSILSSLQCDRLWRSHKHRRYVWSSERLFLWVGVQQRPPCSHGLLSAVQTGVCVCVCFGAKRSHWCLSSVMSLYIKVIIC